MSFTLELFSEQEMPQVLSEIRRVLRNSGRFGVVALDRPEKPKVSTRVYHWLHEAFPSTIDCRPIDVEQVLTDNGFRVTKKNALSLWGLPVIAAVAEKC